MLYEYSGARPEIGEGCFIAPSADVIGKVGIGDGSSVWFNAVIRGDLNSIRIGKRTSIQDNSVLHTEQKLAVDIGDDVVIGHRCIIHAAKIGNGTIIGMGAVVLSGAEVGKDCIIGAGSVVTEGTSIPEGSIAMGIPAKVVKTVTREHIERIRANVKEYCELNESYLRGNFHADRDSG